MTFVQRVGGVAPRRPDRPVVRAALRGRAPSPPPKKKDDAAVEARRVQACRASANEGRFATQAGMRLHALEALIGQLVACAIFFMRLIVCAHLKLVVFGWAHRCRRVKEVRRTALRKTA